MTKKPHVVTSVNIIGLLSIVKGIFYLASTLPAHYYYSTALGANHQTGRTDFRLGQQALINAIGYSMWIMEYFLPPSYPELLRSYDFFCLHTAEGLISSIL